MSSVFKDIVEKKHYRFIDGEGVTWQEAVRLSAEPLVADGTVSEDYYKQIVACIEKYGPYVVFDHNVATLILLGGGSFAAGAAGQFFLNLSMPITLFLLYRCMPDSPGFAFGLAASALWPGALFGGRIPASGASRVILVVLCFGLALFAVLFAERRLSHEKES